MIIYLLKNFSIFIFTKDVAKFRFPGLSRTFQDFPGPASEFQDFPGLENDFLKFQDFPGSVRTLELLILRLKLDIFAIKMKWQTSFDDQEILQ